MREKKQLRVKKEAEQAVASFLAEQDSSLRTHRTLACVVTFESRLSVLTLVFALWPAIAFVKSQVKMDVVLPDFVMKKYYFKKIM